MGMFVNPDNLAFQAALNARIYVDKSGILNYTNSVLGSTDAFICNSRPRRFGKSVTAKMLTAYYSKGCNSEEMFSRLEISQAEDFRKHLNQYDVIHWDIQWCMGPANGPEKVVSYISEKTISELRGYYPDVLPAENHSLAETLARINTVTGRKFIVIIDEWDVLIRDEAAKDHPVFPAAGCIQHPAAAVQRSRCRRGGTLCGQHGAGRCRLQRCAHQPTGQPVRGPVAGRERGCGPLLRREG